MRLLVLVSFSLVVGKQVAMAAPAENQKLDADKIKFIQDEIEKKMLQNEVAKEMQLTKMQLTKPVTDDNPEDTAHTSKHSFSMPVMITSYATLIIL